MFQTCLSFFLIGAIPQLYERKYLHKLIEYIVYIFFIHPFSPITIYFHPFSSLFIHFHPFSSIYIHHRPFSIFIPHDIVVHIL